MQGIFLAQGQLKTPLEPLASLQKVAGAGLDQGQSLLAETLELGADRLGLLGCELAASGDHHPIARLHGIQQG
jgi:hypothetical protein